MDIRELVTAFGLGELTREPVVAAAGWGGHNHVWRVDTRAGAFALKEARRPVGEDILSAIEIERAAVAAGIPAPSPIAASDGRWVIADGSTWYRCHEWVGGKTKRNEDATPAEAAAMGSLVARLHGLALPATRAEPVGRFGAAHWSELAERGRAKRWAVLVRAHLPEMLAVEAAAPEARGGRVGSHRDLNAHNVLFDDDRLVLIDWDAAGPAWPPNERAAFAVTWASRDGGRLDLETAVAFLRGYVEGGGAVEPSDTVALGARLSGLLWWTEHNVQLALRGIGDDQDALAALLVEAVIDARRALADDQRFLARALASV